ncbi:hypothetical protein M0E87_09170 [Corynebacterium sp. CCM 9185]|uniref:DUF8175 domain-containing protein n=1 Tax=Corynebacterium marambiense TaxID=2765364 RepID=A0ABS0VWW4_9CORY|nr:hypothetical protein [Corynebacterium marambiense]MBI9001271.1 hypothetical protein [Corynebacterium marambiense]MCK7663825.1 hypothetical protein [Corynebacterium marambiense]MCX7542973.1 hypothetical protein [Corynebacterium marambiense]
MRKSSGYDSSTLTPRGLFATLTTLTVAGLIAASAYMYIGDEEAGAATSGQPSSDPDTSTSAVSSSTESAEPSTTKSSSNPGSSSTSTSESATAGSSTPSATSQSSTTTKSSAPRSSTSSKTPESAKSSSTGRTSSSSTTSSSTTSTDKKTTDKKSSTSSTTTSTSGSKTSEPSEKPAPSALADKAYAADIKPAERRTTDADGITVYYPKDPAGDVFTDDGEALVPGDDNWLTAAPKVEWQRLKESEDSGTAWDFPFSASDGPWQVTDGVAHGFSRTPQGAALAAWHIFQGVNRGGIDAVRSARVFLPPSMNPARLDAALADPSIIPETPDYSAPIPVAYKVDSFDEEAVIITFATAQDDDVVSVVTMMVEWVDGDWHQSDQFIRSLKLTDVDEIEDWARW